MATTTLPESTPAVFTATAVEADVTAHLPGAALHFDGRCTVVESSAVEVTGLPIDGNRAPLKAFVLEERDLRGGRRCACKRAGHCDDHEDVDVYRAGAERRHRAARRVNATDQRTRDETERGRQRPVDRRQDGAPGAITQNVPNRVDHQALFE